MANEFIARKGLIALEDSQITGSLNISSTLKIPGFSDVSASLAAAVAGGDNLGNHTATQDLNMGGNAIISVGNVDGVDVSALNTSVSTNTTNITTLTAATSSYLTSVSDGTLSGSAQIATEISGAFTAASSSFNTRVAANETITAKTLVSGAGQINDLINDAIAATIVAEIDNDEIPIAKLAEDAVTVNSGNGLLGGGSITLGNTRTLSVDSASIAPFYSSSMNSFTTTGDISGSTIEGQNLISDGPITASGNIKIAAGTNLPTTINSNGIDFNPEHNGNGVAFKVDDTNSKTSFEGLIEFELNANRIELGQSATQHVTASGNISASSDIIGNDITSSNNILIKGGGLSIKNKGAQSYARFYCESNNAHYTEIKAQEHANFSGNVTLLLPAYDFDFASPDFGSADLAANNLSGTNTGDQDLSGLALKTAVSGAFTAASASLAADIATNTGNIGTTTNALTVDNATLQLNTGTTFNGSAARTISIKDGGVDSDALAADIEVTTLTATKIITTQFTSSFITSSTIVTEGSNIFGDTSADTHTFNGDITASGNISASGQLFAASLSAGVVSSTLATAIITRLGNDAIPIAKLTEDAITVTAGNGLSGGGSVTLGNSITINSDGLLSSSAQIASDISGSFTAASSSFSTRVTANDAKLTANTANVTTAGALMDSELADLAAVKAINQGLTTTSNVTFNDVDVDGTLSIPGINDVSASLAAAIAGGDNLGNHTATQELDLDGNNIKDALHITASGNISASGDIAGNTITVANTQVLDLHSSGFRLGNADENLNVFGNTLILYPNVTASGNISSSGFISASAFVGDGSGLTGLSSAAITTYNNSGDNRILTSVNSTTVNSEANLTFDGSGLSVTGHITASGNISASGKIITSELSALGDLIIDADGADILLKDGGTEFGRFKRDSSDFIIKSATNNKDIVFRGIDDSATITALTLDMSDAGKAFFTSDISASGIESSGDIHLSTSNTQITQKLSGGATRDLIGFDGNDNAVIGNPTANKIKLEGNVTASGNISASGAISASAFVGDGSGLTGVGTVDTTGTPADDQIAVFTDANTIEGTTKLTFSNSELLVHSTNTDNTGIEIFGGVFGVSQPYISPVGANSRMNFGDGTSGHIFDFGNNKISFDSDSTNTFIQADTDDPENLEIHADNNIELNADNLVTMGTASIEHRLFDTGSTHLNANSAIGDIVKFGGSTTVAGGIYYLNSSGGWSLAIASAAATSTGSLAVAVGTNSTTDGMCLRGFVNPFTDPDAGIGNPVYLSDSSQGRFQATAPDSNNDVVRILGYQYGTDLIYFNPSNDFIVITA